MTNPETFDSGWVTYTTVSLQGRILYVQKRDGCSRTKVGTPGIVDLRIEP